MTTGNVAYKIFKFKWRIFDIQFNPQQAIESKSISIPPFSGALWCLRVKLLEPGNLKSLKCYLHRIPSVPGPECIYLSYQLQVSGDRVETKSQFFQLVQFENVELLTDESISKMDVEVLFETPQLNDELLVECTIFRSHMNYIPTKLSYAINMAQLSQDIFLTWARQMFSDFQLICKDEIFYVHKAILSTRLPHFAAFHKINYSMQSVATISIVEPLSLKSLLLYAYTGTVNQEVFVEMREFHFYAGALGMSDLQQLLDSYANNYVAKTTMNIQRKVFTWVVQHQLIWDVGLHMDIAILPIDIGNCKYINIAYEIVQFDNMPYLRLNFQIPRLYKEYPIFMSFTLKVMKKDETLLVKKFVNLFTTQEMWTSESLISMAFMRYYGIPMSLRFELDLCDGEDKSSIEESEAELVYGMPISMNFAKLSYDLENLFSTGKYHDVVLVTEQKSEIPAHQCILGSRSITFMEILSNRNKQTKFIPINGITTDELLFVLYYIYTGKTRGFKKSDASKFNTVAKCFQLPGLVSEIDTFIQSM